MDAEITKQYINTLVQARARPHGMARGPQGTESWIFDTVDLPEEVPVGQTTYFDWMHTPEVVAAHLDGERTTVILTALWMQFGDGRIAPEYRFMGQHQSEVLTVVRDVLPSMVLIRNLDDAAHVVFASYPLLLLPGRVSFYVPHAVGCLVKKNLLPGWDSRRLLFDAVLDVLEPVTLPFPMSVKLAVCWYEAPKFTPRRRT